MLKKYGLWRPDEGLLHKRDELHSGLEHHEVNFPGGHNGRKEEGLSDEEIMDIASRSTGFLGERVWAETAEDVLHKDMWDSADVDERKTIVSIFFKIHFKEK